MRSAEPSFEDHQEAKKGEERKSENWFGERFFVSAVGSGWIN